MYIFIDESGIHKDIDHSCVAVVYIEVDNYPVFESVVSGVEKKLGIQSFHWSDTVRRVKERFMDEVLRLDFKAKAAVIKNPANLENNLETILAHMIVEKRIATIYLDGKKPKWYEHKIKKILRDKGIGIKKLKTVKDSQFAGIRVADMAAGLVRSVADGKNLGYLMPYFERLKQKILFSIDI